MINNVISLCEPFPKLTAERLWVEYYRGDCFSIGRVADWSLMVVLSGGFSEYDEEGAITVTNYYAWHIDRAYAEKIIDNNRVFTADLSSKTFDRDADLIIRTRDAVQVLSAIRDEVAAGTRECRIDSGLEEELLTYKTDKEKMKANREQNETRKKALLGTKPPWYIWIIDNPLKRFLYGAIVVAIGGAIPPLFPLCGLLCIPFFFFGESQTLVWHETGRKLACDKCGTEGDIRILQLNRRMHLPFLRRFTSITYYKTYFAVCSGCMAKHIDDEDAVNLLFNIAKSGSIYVKPLTKAEFAEMTQ